MSIEEFKKIDFSFNEGMFLTKINNIFVKFLTAIMLDKLDNIKHFVNNDVYKYGLSIINNAKVNGYRQMYDEINVKDSKIIDVLEKDDVYIIKVYLQSRYMDYIISLDNGSLVSGNNNSRIQVNYELYFTKRKNSNNSKLAKKCPSCGAPMNVNNSGKCEYCNSTYNSEDYDWILTKLEIC